ncbi:MAG: HAMP domain-containing sensor histidine kinase [Candidatus Eiseniibacteriota bacterium]
MADCEPSSLAAQREFSLFSLLELCVGLNATSDLYELADMALFNIMGHLGCSRVGVWALGDEPTDAVLLRSHGWPPEATASGSRCVRWLVSEHPEIDHPVLVAELARSHGDAPIHEAEQHAIEVLAPITAHGRTFGATVLGPRIARIAYTALELQMLHASMGLLGGCMESLRLYNSALDSNRRLKLANAQLQELDQLKSQFLDNLNHELKTPITIMMAYLERLTGVIPPGSELRQLVDVLDEQTSKLRRMVVNLLDFSQVVSDELQVSCAAGRIADSLEEYGNSRRPGIAATLRELTSTSPTDLPPAQYDQDRLVQVLDCLIDNVVKFTPQGSHIHLESRLERGTTTDWVCVDVRDDGPGIARERLPYVFQPFRQGDGSLTRPNGGMGMGLALAKRLTESMGGQLDVESEPGVGTTFTLRLRTAA